MCVLDGSDYGDILRVRFLIKDVTTFVLCYYIQQYSVKDETCNVCVPSEICRVSILASQRCRYGKVFAPKQSPRRSKTRRTVDDAVAPVSRT